MTRIRAACRTLVNGVWLWSRSWTRADTWACVVVGFFAGSLDDSPVWRKWLLLAVFCLLVGAYGRAAVAVERKRIRDEIERRLIQ